MPDGIKLHARIAEPIESDCGESYIVETHGLFCGQEGYEARNLSEALRRWGHHVVAIEMRGHGQTEQAYPSYPMSFGASEVRDLLEVARWLRQERGAKRIGLLSYSITAQQAMAAAWVDGGGVVLEPENLRQSPIFRNLPGPSEEPLYNAGIIAVAPPTNLLEYADTLEQRYTVLESPVRATFQYRIAQRLQAQGEPPAHSMWAFARHELARSGWGAQYADADSALRDVVGLVDFSGDGWERGADRLERVRTPLLIIASVNDPLGSAQATVDLVSRVENADVGLLLFPGGGHTGMSAMNAPLYQSIIRAFFDPQCGPLPFGSECEVTDNATAGAGLR
jgi:predicted alpha/beta-fold hydrolase